jgi:hypothetical protein
MADLRENYGSTSSQKYDSVDEYLQQFDETKQNTVRLIFKVMASKYRNMEVVIAGIIRFVGTHLHRGVDWSVDVKLTREIVEMTINS